jgi:nucleoid DNA-binding protein
MISADSELDLSKKDVERVLNKLISIIEHVRVSPFFFYSFVIAVLLSQEVLDQENVVQLTKFGSFRLKDMPSRMYRNPRTGAPVKSTASKSIKFSASVSARR